MAARRVTFNARSVLPQKSELRHFNSPTRSTFRFLPRNSMPTIIPGIFWVFSYPEIFLHLFFLPPLRHCHRITFWYLVTLTYVLPLERAGENSFDLSTFSRKRSDSIQESNPLLNFPEDLDRRVPEFTSKISSTLSQALKHPHAPIYLRPLPPPINDLICEKESPT